MSKPYAEVIGDPISHSKSPLIHNFWLAKLGIQAEYRSHHVKLGGLAEYFTQRREDAGWRGCNVTVPHKEKVAPYLDRVRPAAAKIGAINTVFMHPDDGLCGTNTDIDGVREALRGLDLTSRPVVLIGAGGAARSALAHLEGLGVGQVRLLARRPDKASAVLQDFNLPSQTFAFVEGGGVFDDAAAVINATQLGMIGQDTMPQFVLDELSRIASDGLVFDMVYSPLETELLQRATVLGRATSHGLNMLVGQARTAFARFFGQVPPDDCDAELRALLTA
jgi:shikimate dehydrogenase